VNAACCNFPGQQHLEGMVNQTQDDFVFGLKITDANTIKNFPKLDRFGDLAGKPNENFRNAELFWHISLLHLPQGCVEYCREQCSRLCYRFLLAGQLKSGQNVSRI
jgi:hypothetical protein